MFILSIFLFTACSLTHFIKNDDSSYKEVNQKLMGKKVTLTLNNGKEISGSNVFVKSDSTSAGEISIPTANINKITNTNHSKGAVNGAIIGLISGAGVGFLIDLATSFEVNDHLHYEYGSLEMSVTSSSGGKGAFIGGMSGLLFGALIGSMNGPTDTFILLQPETGDKTDVSLPKNEDNSYVRVKISSIVEKTVKHIIVLWQSKEIRLLSSEYNYMVRADDGKQSMDHKTLVRYIHLLEKAFVIIRVGGFSRNLRNEIVKKNKFYL